MTIITKSMLNDAVYALKSNDASLAKEVLSTDNEVDRFNIYITRLLKTAVQNPRVSKEIGVVNARDCLSYRVVTRLVERTADHAVNIATNTLALKNQLSDDIVERIIKMSSIAITMFDSSMESLFRQDYNSAEKVIEDIDVIASLERQAVTSCQIDVEDSAALRLIIESIRRTAEHACDIAETVLNLTINSILV
jgi:phosphate uptake regulator